MRSMSRMFIYVENNLGGFENKDEKIKPDCELIGQDGIYLIS